MNENRLVTLILWVILAVGSQRNMVTHNVVHLCHLSSSAGGVEVEGEILRHCFCDRFPRCDLYLFRGELPAIRLALIRIEPYHDTGMVSCRHLHETMHSLRIFPVSDKGRKKAYLC